ncbi:putative glycosyl hydrolase protein [Scedosporium apiospermum]|uniref:Putative glycosyl hydrolase protein n=1 Tax=Pseudallescheria apiosperma TaxID=563466 RepID=A0A084G1E1_PSEDA|nr:putative glycosyl hydrolase protein [Scedosporium apiospermum]KEZ41153.1 putative glycosyl hydrolase protein [Scedosporium apiospermum]
MMRLRISFAHILLGGLATVEAADLAGFVRTNTGSIGGGNTFPGVTRPLGMIKLGPDLYNGRDSYSGYQPDGNFIGFSMLHESGTGGAPKYGVVAQMPVVGEIPNPLADISQPRGADDVTEVGYYRSTTQNGIEIELAAASRAGFYQYTFPEGQGDPAIVVDVSHVLKSYRGMGLEQHYLGGGISVHKEGEQGHLSYRGYGRYDNGWNKAPTWVVYFCGYFDKPATYKTFLGTRPDGEDLDWYEERDKVDFSLNRLGAVFSFKDTEVKSRVGVSFISTDQACRNVNNEIPDGTSLSKLRDDTRKEWGDKVLSKVTTTETDPELLARLYSALYFMNLLPQNKTGENPLWESEEPYYDDIFTFWDTFRCTTSLFHILQPETYEEFIRSWVDIWRHEGFMSDARSSFWNGAVQGGSNVDNVFADAYVKGVRGKINWEDAYQAMVTDAEVAPPPGTDNRDAGGSAKEGRGALPDWLSRGYITTKFARSVTRAVEYSTNDFALYQVALGLGHKEDAAKYLGRSRNWRNHWNKDMAALGHSGFLGPRDEGGNFIDQDPLSCGGCYWGNHYYQGLPWEYTFNAHHDISTLIDWSGGKDAFIDRLELTFRPGIISGNEQFDHTIFNPGNEPSFGTPYLYNFVGRQDLSSLRSRFIAKSYYSPTPGGLPGNSDAGAMESWLLWNMIGLYPLTGQTTFLIGSPWLKDLTINLGGGAKLEITAQGASSEDAIYVQSLKVNGKDWDKAWVSWNDVFRDGGKMEFILGKSPVNWATGPPPPSPAVGDGLDVPEPPESPERRRSLTTRDYIAGGVIVVALGGSVGLIITLGYKHVSKKKDKTAKSGYRRARVSDSGEEPESDRPFEESDSDLERALDTRSRSRRSALRS